MSNRRPSPNRPPDTRPATKPKYRTREEAIHAAGYQLALARRELLERHPRESAIAAYVTGGPSVDELERRIRERFFKDEEPT